MFAIILVHSHPIDAKGILESYKESFSTDLQKRFRRRPQLSNKQLALQHMMPEIQERPGTMSSSVLAEFGLPSARANLPPLMAQTQDRSLEELRRLADEYTS